MSLTTKLTDKLEREIREFCKMNNLQLGEYIGKCIEKQFNIDRYGDLNEKFLPIDILAKKETKIEKIEVETPKDEAKGTILVVQEPIELKKEEPQSKILENETKKRIRTIESK